MSYTTLYRIGEDGALFEHARFSNSWGSAARVWEAIHSRHLCHKRGRRWHEPGEMQATWRLADDATLPLFARSVLMATFDRAVLETARFVEFAAHCRAFGSEYPAPAGCVDHLPDWAVEFDRLAFWDQPLLGACFQQTSVAGCVWYEYDEQTETTQPYDFLSGTNHFFVFADLEAPRNP